MYVYIYIERERDRERGRQFKNKVIQREKYDIKESPRYNISILLNRRQNLVGFYGMTLKH